MQQENYLIGIGGTGARALEAFVHCCAAGCMPQPFGSTDNKVHLLLVDPDEANSNLARTTGLIKEYMALRSSLREGGNRVEADNHAFATELIAPKAGLVWTVLGKDKQGQKLSNYIRYDNLSDPLKATAELLFEERELTTELNEGFRGHPAIGAVVMANPPLEDGTSPMSVLTDGMAPNKAARVFLVGSIFGGTGAAGFPTLGKVLKNKLGGKWGSFTLGGALVLPYFSLDENIQPTDGKMFVKASGFASATEAALRYYNNEGKLHFDQYYFMGDSLGQKVGAFSPGGKEQNNLPHYIELTAALAALDFFGQDDAAVKEPGAKFFAASRAGEAVDWNALPISRGTGTETRRGEVKRALRVFTIFCYVYLKFGLPELKRSGEERMTDTWFADSFLESSLLGGKKSRPENTADKNPAHEANNELLKIKMRRYALHFLQWFTDLSAGRSVKLLETGNLRPSAGQSANASLQESDLAALGANIGALFHDPGQESGKDWASYLAHSLNGNPIADPTQKAGLKYLDLFFKASRHFLTT